MELLAALLQRVKNITCRHYNHTCSYQCINIARRHQSTKTSGHVPVLNNAPTQDPTSTLKKPKNLTPSVSPRPKGRPPLNLEPYREIMVQGYKRGVTPKQLSESLRLTNVHVGQGTLRKRLLGWGAGRVDIVEQQREIVEECVRLRVSYVELQRRLRERGILVSKRTLWRRMREWEVPVVFTDVGKRGRGQK